jgi:hypothetical protein
MRGIILQYSAYVLKVSVTHPDECRKEQEASGIHTKKRGGLEIGPSLSFALSSQKRSLKLAPSFRHYFPLSESGDSVGTSS